MATVTAARAAATFPVFAGSAGNLRAAYGTYEVASNLAASTIIEMCRLPAGAIVVGGWIMGDDLDTGTEELNWDIGWAANGGSGTYDTEDTDGFGDLGVITGDAITELKPVAGIYFPLQGKLLTDGPITFTRETIVKFTVNVDAAAGGTGTISVVVLYILP